MSGQHSQALEGLEILVPDPGKFRVYAQIFPCLKAEKVWLTVSYFLYIQTIGFMRNLTTYSG